MSVQSIKIIIPTGRLGLWLVLDSCQIPVIVEEYNWYTWYNWLLADTLNSPNCVRPSTNGARGSPPRRFVTRRNLDVKFGCVCMYRQMLPGEETRPPRRGAAQL